MGGAEGAGNVTAAAEFNFHADPEAAHLVLKRFPVTVLCTWEATQRCALDWAWVERWYSKATPKALFVRETMKGGEAYCRKHDPGWVCCDAVAVAVALEDSSLVLKRAKYHVEVECTGALTRGMAVFDRRSSPGCKPPNVLLPVELDLNRYRALMEQITD